MKKLGFILGFLAVVFLGFSQESKFYSTKMLTELLNEEVQKEINWVRQDPERYRTIIKDLGRLDSKRYEKNGNRQYFILEKTEYFESRSTTHEGISAYKEMDRFLKKQNSLPVYSYNSGLQNEAKKQCEYILSSGKFSHDRPDGKGLSYVENLKGEGLMLVGEVLAKLDERLPPKEYEKHELKANLRAISQEIVVGWIVDDGIPNRGHRTAIFHEQHKFFGAYCLIEENGTVICAVEFATLPIE